MGLGDRIRRFFERKKSPALDHLELFARNHKGVEGFIEPQTPTNPTTLLLVDRIGEHMRGAVSDPEAAALFCDRLGIPVYDAAVIGYPQRLRDYEHGRAGAGDPDDLDRRFAEFEKQFGETEGTDPQ